MDGGRRAQRGRSRDLPSPMQFILDLYSSHKYTKKGGTRLLKEIRRRGPAAPTEAELAGKTNVERERLRAAEGGDRE